MTNHVEARAAYVSKVIANTEGYPLTQENIEEAFFAGWQGGVQWSLDEMTRLRNKKRPDLNKD